MKHAGSIVINRPIEDVFELTINHVAEWSIIVVEDTPIEETAEGVGTTFKTVTEDNGRRMEFDGVVTRHDPPHDSAIKLTGKMFDIETAYHFEDLSGRTRVTQSTQVRGKGIFKVLLFVGGIVMRKAHCEATQREMESLKQFCESRVAEPVG